MDITANTKVSNILDEYGDIAEVMETFGLKARVQRIVQSIGYEGEHLRRIESELNEGNAVIVVAVDDHDTKRGGCCSPAQAWRTRHSLLRPLHHRRPVNSTG